MSVGGLCLGRGSRRAEASRGYEELPFPIGRERKAGANVVTSEFGEVGENLGLGHAGREILQDVLNCDAHAPNTRLPTALAGFNGNHGPVVHAKNLSLLLFSGKGWTDVTSGA